MANSSRQVEARLIRTAAARLARASPLRPSLAVILGSGFHMAASRLEVMAEVPFASLPGFPIPSVAGHAGRVLLGHCGGSPVCFLSGRAHFYEGHSLDTVTFPVRVLAAFGIRTLLITNAAGGIYARYRPGDFMCLRDHLNWMGANPLRGPRRPDRESFVDLSQVYEPRLNRILARAARKLRIPLHTGVYLAVSGPSYETPAEIRAFAGLGADAVGMSTVPEAMVARQCGMEVAGLSCITNLAAGRGNALLSHADVLAAGARAGERAAALLEQFVLHHAARA
ncbi:MAG TPA: purine-nucleoside phosphorylase [Candidatus Saccharimonadales bacterium]|jgi:inosine/guanosine/xanthosine phosphorylase family protein|nr:purine-nucleoside phosphorylase [Candidatus Saccharimonadales bacterium]